jgi:RNA-directed DNA polymerase
MLLRRIHLAPLDCPLLANLYLNALDWAVNDPGTRGQPMLIRYADDFVILCGAGQGGALRDRLERWLQARGLELNKEKTRVPDSREGFDFPGFRVRWQKSARRGNWYAHTEASPKSQQKLRQAVRDKLNHWTQWKNTKDIIAELNRTLRGWASYFHFGNSSRVMNQLNWQVRNRVRRWLWRKHARKRSLWKDYPDHKLHEQYGLWELPIQAGWKPR